VYYLSFYGKFNDFLWDSVNITIWTACELNIGIFAASIATLRPLFRSAFQGSSAYSTGGYADNEKQQHSLDKNGFVKHISNSRGTSKVGGSQSSKSDGFEMFGSVVTANDRLAEDNESEESILPMQKPQPMAIRKTTEVTVDETQMKRPVEDRV